MDFFQLLVLAVLQGLTEFLPISSAAHLILVPVLTDWSDQGLTFDVAVHMGTLTAVVVYFWAQLRSMAMEWIRSFSGQLTPDGRLAWAVLFGTIPVGLAGALFQDIVASDLRSPIVIGLASIVFGLLLWWADRQGARLRDEHTITWRDVLAIGCAQALALIPGTSRSGITMTAGLAMGLTRAGAARFSFLLSIPVTALAGGLLTYELVQRPQEAHWDVLMAGALISGVTAYLCIHVFLRLLERIGMLPFVIYRVVLGILLLVLFA